MAQIISELSHNGSDASTTSKASPMLPYESAGNWHGIKSAADVWEAQLSESLILHTPSRPGVPQRKKSPFSFCINSGFVRTVPQIVLMDSAVSN